MSRFEVPLCKFMIEKHQRLSFCEVCKNNCISIEIVPNYCLSEDIHLYKIIAKCHGCTEQKVLDISRLSFFSNKQLYPTMDYLEQLYEDGLLIFFKTHIRKTNDDLYNILDDITGF